MVISMGTMDNEHKLKFCEMHLSLSDYPSFKLENAVCNHGFFMMAPNEWDPSPKCFKRPLRLSDSITSVNVSIQQNVRDFLLIKVHDMEHLSPPDKEAIMAQVVRMFRLSAKDEKDVEEFHKIHQEAKQRGFGRIFRAPSLFEDFVKSLLLCFCSFRDSLKMARSLCDLQLELSNGSTPGEAYRHSREDEGKGLKRKRAIGTRSVWNFPNAKELASLDLEFLQNYSKLGIRALPILELAKNVYSGKCQLRKFEECKSSKELTKKLKKLKGFGQYASANVSMCLGFYQDVPVDSETKRHLKEVHGKKVFIRKDLEEIYGKSAPFQSMEFWCELTGYYEGKFGKLSELQSSKYDTVTGSQIGTKQRRSQTVTRKGKKTKQHFLYKKR